MSQVSSYPLIDNYDETLSRERDGNIWSIYVSATPTFTFPSWVTTYVVVDPWKENMQLAVIDSYNSTTKTLNCTSITVEKWAGVNYTAQTHAIGSVVRISNNYAFWKDMVTAVNNKVNTNSSDIADGKFANAAARDAYFTSPVNGNSAYLTTEGKWTDYVSWSRQDRASGANPNASITVAGKLQEATIAQGKNWTKVGSTWADLTLTPDVLAAIIQSGSYLYCWASATGNDTYVVSATPALTAYTTWMRVSFQADVANTTACTINIDGLGAKAIQTYQWYDIPTWYILANQIVLLTYYWSAFCIDNPFWPIPHEYGDWSDWDVTISGTVTLTKDMYYNNLTIPASQTLNPAWYRIFVKWIMSWTGTISRNWTAWNAWSGQTAWSWWTMSQGSLNAEVASSAWWNWANNGSWTAWAAWVASSPSLSNTNGSGWWAWWWAGSSWWAGWSWGATTRGSLYQTLYFPQYVHPATAQATFWWLAYKNSATAWWGGWWASGWPWAIWWGWGWGWQNWWLIWIACNIWNFTWTVTAVWWAGGAWADASWAWQAWWWWWGWGWNGWILFRLYRQIQTDATITLTGWAGWAWGAWQSSWASWTAWTAWSAWTTISLQVL